MGKKSALIASVVGLVMAAAAVGLFDRSSGLSPEDHELLVILPIADDAIIEAFGAELAAQLVSPNPEMDFDAVVARNQFALRGIPSNVIEERVGYVRGVASNDTPLIVEQVRARVSEGGQLKYLGTAVRDGYLVTRFRLVADLGGVDFFDFLIGVRDEEPVVVDAFILNTGQWQSEAFAEFFFMAAGGGVSVAEAEQLAAIGEAARDERYEDVLRLYDALPETLRALRSMWTHRITAASETSDVERHLAILDEYKTLFPNDPAARMHLLNAHFEREQWEQASEDLDTLEAAFPDAYWLGLRASIALEQEQYALTMRLAERLMRDDPTLIEGPDFALIASLALDDLESANRFATVLRDDFYVDPRTLAPEPDYEGLAELPVYAQPWNPSNALDNSAPSRVLQASSLPAEDLGEERWDTHNASLLQVEGNTATWQRPAVLPDNYPPAWVPAPTLARLHSGTFRWDFEVEHMQNAQLGVGFMLVFEDGVDWGFFGYLGAGQEAWSYDPSTGDVVSGTVSIASGLPVFEDGESGTVSVELELPRDTPGRGRFIVNGRRSPDIELPAGAVVMPAACFLREGQQVRFGEVVREQ